MDSLFEASFNPTASSGKPFSKCGYGPANHVGPSRHVSDSQPIMTITPVPGPECGQCLRYLKLINTRPQRLYCPTQEEVHELPQAGGVC